MPTTGHDDGQARAPGSKTGFGCVDIASGRSLYFSRSMVGSMVGCNVGTIDPSGRALGPSWIRKGFFLRRRRSLAMRFSLSFMPKENRFFFLLHQSTVNIKGFTLL